MSKLIWNDPMPYLKSRATAYSKKVGEEIAKEARKTLSKRGDGKGSTPHKRTGRLLKSVEVETDPTTGETRVGTNWFVGFLQEVGTRLMPANPWLGPAWRKVAVNPPRPDPDA